MNVRRLVLVSFVLFVLAAGSAGWVHAWDIEWIDQFGTPGTESTSGVAVDPTGVYVAGGVLGALPGQAGAGGFDAYVRKYDFNGHVIWTRQFGTLSTEISGGLARDATGIYVAGGTGGILGQAGAGRFDTFVRKYNADGTLLWTIQFGTTETDVPFVHGIASHSSGIYVAGGTFGTFPGAPAGVGLDTFVARLDPDAGTVVWVRQFGIRGSDTFLQLGGVAADDAGIYVATTVAFPGSEDLLAVLRKYDFDGNLVWSRELPSTSDCVANFRDVASNAGKTYVIGQWSNGALAGPGFCRNRGFEAGPVVGVLQAFDAAGSLLWTRGIKGGTRTGKDAFTGGKNVTASDAGIFVGANLQSSFPGHPPGGSKSGHSECPGLGLPGAFGAFADELDAYVRRYDFNGNVVWTHQFGSPVFDIVTNLAADGTSVYAVGDTSCRVAAETTFFGGDRDAFVVRMAIDPTSPSGLVQLVVGRLDTLNDKGRFTPGEFASVVQRLEAALSAIERGDAPLARQILETFIRDVEQQRKRGTLSSADVAPLIDGANAVIAKL